MLPRQKLGPKIPPMDFLTTPIFITIGNKLGVGEIEIEVTLQQIIIE